MEINFLVLLLLLHIQCIISVRYLANLPVRLTLIYYEIEGKGAKPSYRFRLDPYHKRSKCEEQGADKYCNFGFKFSRCSSSKFEDEDPVPNGTATCDQSSLEGVPGVAFYTCDPKMKRLINGLNKPIDGLRTPCLNTTLQGSGTKIDVEIFQNNKKLVAKTSINLGRGRQMEQVRCDDLTLCRMVRFMTQLDDFDY